MGSYLRAKPNSINNHMNITHIGSKTEDSTHYNTIQVLESVISQIKNGELECNKLLVLTLDDTDGQYNTTFTQGQMSMSECISLCDISKTLFMREMDLID